MHLTKMPGMWAVATVLAGCLHQPVAEQLTLYQGDPIAQDGAIVFEEGEFVLPQGRRIARQGVQSIEFRADEDAGAETAKTDFGGALAPIEQGLLVDRGVALAARHPGASGVILLDDGEFVYNKDGTSRYRYHFAGLVLKEDMKSWAQITFGFTKGRSRVNLLYARSISQIGEVQDLDAAALQTGSPSEDVAFFNPNRKVVSGTVPGVEVGSIVEYAYEYESYDPEDPRLFFPGFFFQSTEPLVLSRVKVVTPAGTPYNHIVRNFPERLDTEPVEEAKDGNVSYTWTVENMPPLSPEPRMPPERDVIPMMDSSVFGSFEDAFALAGGFQTPRIELTPAIEAKVAEITEGAESIDDKLARIYHWMQENTHYVSIKGSLGAGWSGHTAQETFENGYGDCTDKGILFATMCQAIGVKSYPIILMTNDAGIGIHEIPTLDANHCINEIELPDGRNFYLDSTAENFRYPYFRPDDHGAYAVNAIRGDIKRIPVPPPEDNRRLSRLSVELRRDGGVLVKTRNAYTGWYEAGVRGFWKSVREDERDKYMTQYVNSISPGAVLESFTLSDVNDLGEPLAMGIDYVLHRHAVRAKDLMYMRVPTLERQYPEAALDERRFPVQYMSSQEMVLEIDIAFPKGFAVQWTPEPIEIASPYLEFSAAYTQEKGLLKLRERFRRLKQVIPPEDYPAYRDALRAIAAFSKKEVFFTVKD